MSAAGDALESLRDLALRSESPESIEPLIKDIAPYLPQEDPIEKKELIVLSLWVNADGQSMVRYLGDPSWAVDQIRAIADQVERETII